MADPSGYGQAPAPMAPTPDPPRRRRRWWLWLLLAFPLLVASCTALVGVKLVVDNDRSAQVDFDEMEATGAPAAVRELGAVRSDEEVPSAILEGDGSHRTIVVVAPGEPGPLRARVANLMADAGFEAVDHVGHFDVYRGTDPHRYVDATAEVAGPGQQLDYDDRDWTVPAGHSAVLVQFG